MNPIDLESPVDGGIAAVNFFNGRLLTANDLRREQQARREADAYLGCALGDGVAFGLTVKKHAEATASKILVTVEAGLALNAAGQALRLKQQAVIALIRKAKPAAGVATTFVACGPQTSGTYVAGAGVYLLTIASATATSGKAPTGGFDAFGGKCNTDTFLESVLFRLLPLDLASVGLAAPGPDARAESLFRNALAAALMSTRIPGHDDPFAGAGADRVGELFSPALSDCDVPLALLYTTQSGGIRFVDGWAVRRRVRPAAQPGAPFLLPGGRAAAIAEARLLQFGAHLDDLLRPDLRPENHRIEDFFRYVPAAAAFPVLSPRFSRGVTPRRFLETFVRDAADRLAAGAATAILARSYAFSLIDLNDHPCLQLYEIEADAGAAPGAPNAQRYQMFLSRRLGGPPSGDGVTVAFRTAWDVYRGLVRRRVFLPVGATSPEIAAQVTLVGAIRDVMDIASRQAAAAGVSGLDEVATRDAFQTLHDVQHDLATLCATPIPDLTADLGRGAFAASLAVLVDGTPPDGSPSLAAALTQASVCAMVGAQEAINKFIAGWSGDGIAVGPVIVTKLDSPDGLNIVPGRDWFRHRYRLANGTDKRLTFALIATATATTGSWQNAAEVRHGTTGARLTSLEVPSGSSLVLEVRVQAPDNAAVGETATLTFNVHAGPPNNRDVTRTLDLGVAATGGEAAPRNVTFDGPSLPPGNSNTKRDEIVTYGFNLIYTAAAGPAEAEFDFTITITEGSKTDWMIAIDTLDLISETPENQYTQRIRLLNGVRKQIAVNLLPIHNAASIRFGVALAAVGLAPQFGAALDHQISITVT